METPELVKVTQRDKPLQRLSTGDDQPLTLQPGVGLEDATPWSFCPEPEATLTARQSKKGPGGERFGETVLTLRKVSLRKLNGASETGRRQTGPSPPAGVKQEKLPGEDFAAH